MSRSQVPIHVEITCSTCRPRVLLLSRKLGCFTIRRGTRLREQDCVGRRQHLRSSRRVVLLETEKDCCNFVAWKHGVLVCLFNILTLRLLFIRKFSGTRCQCIVKTKSAMYVTLRNGIFVIHRRLHAISATSSTPLHTYLSVGAPPPLP